MTEYSVIFAQKKKKKKKKKKIEACFIADL